MAEFEVWVQTIRGRDKEVIEAVDLRAASAKIHKKYLGVHMGFFIMPRRRRPGSGRGRSLPFARDGGLDYGENQDQVVDDEVIASIMERGL